MKVIPNTTDLESLSEHDDSLIKGDTAAGRAMRIYNDVLDYIRTEPDATNIYLKDAFDYMDIADLMGYVFSGDAEKYLKRIKYDWGMGE